MKPILHAVLIAIIALSAACSPSEPSQVSEVTKPPPVPEPEIVPLPAPREVRIQVRSGILDWQEYDHWLTSPPTFLLVNRLDTATRSLLQERMQLSEVILHSPKETVKKDYTTAVEQLKARAPGSVRGRYAASVTTTQQHVVDDYMRRWTSITPINLSSVVIQLERQYDRDIQQYSGNVSTTKGGEQAAVNLSYVQKWKPLLTSAKRLVEEMQKPAEMTPREKALLDWAAFQQNDLPLVERVIAEKTIAGFPLEEDGRFEVEGEGELLIQIEIAGQKILYFKDGRHRFRFFNENQTTRIVQETIAQTD